METEIMRELVVEPGRRPIVEEIETGLEALQAPVGGLIEAVYPFEEPVAIVSNEESKLLELPLNRTFWSKTATSTTSSLGRSLSSV